MRNALLALVGALTISAVAHAAEPEFTLKLATVAPEGTPWADIMKSYKKRVESESNGRIKVKAFLGGVLGDENATVAETRRGAISMWGGSTGALASSVPELNLLELPFLFGNAEEADYILDDVLFEDFKKLMAARGFVLLFWAENGYRSFGTKFGFIKTPADLKGHKMRSQESFVHLETYRALGALPQPIATTEVLQSLQTGVVDGYDQTPLYTFAASWHAETKYYTVTNHIYQPAAIVMSKIEFDKLPADVQKIVLGDQKKQAIAGRVGVRDMTPLLLDNFKSAKIELYTPNAAELAAFATATRPVYGKFTKEVPSAKPLLDKALAALKTKRGK